MYIAYEIVKHGKDNLEVADNRISRYSMQSGGVTGTPKILCHKTFENL
jgi:hypothetical protein